MEHVQHSKSFVIKRFEKEFSITRSFKYAIFEQDLSTIFNSILEDFVILYIHSNFDYMILNFIVMITQNIECLLWQTSL